jgi:hypothetical protein
MPIRFLSGGLSDAAGQRPAESYARGGRYVPPGGAEAIRARALLAEDQLPEISQTITRTDPDSIGRCLRPLRSGRRAVRTQQRESRRARACRTPPPGGAPRPAGGSRIGACDQGTHLRSTNREPPPEVAPRQCVGRDPLLADQGTLLRSTNRERRVRAIRRRRKSGARERPPFPEQATEGRAIADQVLCRPLPYRPVEATRRS